MLSHCYICYTRCKSEDWLPRISRNLRALLSVRNLVQLQWSSSTCNLPFVSFGFCSSTPCLSHHRRPRWRCHSLLGNLARRVLICCSFPKQVSWILHVLLLCEYRQKRAAEGFCNFPPCFQASPAETIWGDCLKQQGNETGPKMTPVLTW